MGTEQTESEARLAARARSVCGVESARSGLGSGGPLPVRGRVALSLQSTAGNRAVSGLVQRWRDGSGEAGLLQGRVAPLQRESAEEEEPLQGRFVTAQLQEAEDEELQIEQAPSLPAQLQPEPPPRRNETGLPDGLKSGIESLSGVTLDDVRVHYGSSKPAQLNALAYAQGSEIHVAPGQEQHLPHEAWHVVQQAQGRVQPTAQLQGGVPVDDNEVLEQEADAMGARALATTKQLHGRPKDLRREPAAVVQRIRYLTVPAEGRMQGRVDANIAGNQITALGEIYGTVDDGHYQRRRRRKRGGSTCSTPGHSEGRSKT